MILINAVLDPDTGKRRIAQHLWSQGKQNFELVLDYELVPAGTILGVIGWWNYPKSRVNAQVP